MKNSFIMSICTYLFVSVLALSITTVHAQSEDCVDFINFTITEEAIGDQTKVVIRVQNFIDIASFQFSLNFDTSVYEFSFVDAPDQIRDGLNFNPDLPNGAAFAWIELTAGVASIEDNEILLEVFLDRIGSGSSDFVISGDPVPVEILRVQNGVFDLLCPAIDGFVNLEGFIRLDETGSCTHDTALPPLTNWKVRISNDNFERIVSTNAEGKYISFLEEGSYIVEVIPPNAAWNVCEQGASIQVVSEEEQVIQNFTVDAARECLDLDVTMTTPFLRRCFDNRYYVYYCNDGTIDAADVSIRVDLDPFFIFDSSDASFTQDGDTYVFDIGNLASLECGRISISGTLSCDAELGQTHCSEAKILPDTNCNIDTYTGAIINVTGACTGDEIEFTVKNTGDETTTQALDIIVVEDDVMREAFDVILEPNQEEVYRYPANGSTYRIIADQELDYPIAATATQAIEACGTNDDGTFSTGFVTMFAADSSDPNNSIDCQENIGSYDPNDKQGFPNGYGEEHYIYPEDELHYLIRFQNTGTDTAFRVRIIDTLPSSLDAATFTPGNASHPYTYDIDGQVITFEFNPIALVDSFRNEPASNGFVDFRIQQKKDIPLGTVIENNADIYFDFNDPVRTNTTFHTVERDFLKVATSVNNIQYQSLGVYPNPVHQGDKVYLDVEYKTDRIVDIYSITGHKIKTLELSKGSKFLNTQTLEKGLYTVKISDHQGDTYVGKLLILNSNK